MRVAKIKYTSFSLSFFVRHTVKNVRPEGSTIVYVQRLGTAFFHQITETCKEFDKSFPGERYDERC